MNKNKLEKKLDKDYKKLIDLIHSIVEKQSIHLIENYDIESLRNGHTELDYAFSIPILTIFKTIADDVKELIQKSTFYQDPTNPKGITQLTLLAEVKNIIIMIENIYKQDNPFYIS